MAITKEFIEAVADGNRIRVRIMLKDIMLVDPSLNTFNEMLEYAEKNIYDLYDSHDGENLITDSSKWDEDYMNQQMVVVVTNFSKERVDLLKRIVKKIYAYKNQNEESNNRYSSNDNDNSRFNGVQIAGGAITAAGTGALVCGIILKSVPVAVIGGVAVVGGIAMICLGRNREE